MTTHHSIIKDLLFKEKLSISEIKERFKGRASPTYIRDICHEVLHSVRAETGLEYRPSKRRSGGFKPLKSTDALSQTHLSIGARLNNFRVIKNNLHTAEFCHRYQFANVIRLRQMEMGQYDFTLSELQRVSEILNLPMEELVKPLARNIYAA